jgi:hypothetical protein
MLNLTGHPSEEGRKGVRKPVTGYYTNPFAGSVRDKRSEANSQFSHSPERTEDLQPHLWTPVSLPKKSHWDSIKGARNPASRFVSDAGTERH